MISISRGVRLDIWLWYQKRTQRNWKGKKKKTCGSHYHTKALVHRWEWEHTICRRGLQDIGGSKERETSWMAKKEVVCLGHLLKSMYFILSKSSSKQRSYCTWLQNQKKGQRESCFNLTILVPNKAPSTWDVIYMRPLEIFPPVYWFGGFCQIPFLLLNGQQIGSAAEGSSESYTSLFAPFRVSWRDIVFGQLLRCCQGFNARRSRGLHRCPGNLWHRMF